MKNLYLNSKQILFLVLPFLILAYIKFNPESSSSMILGLESMTGEGKVLSSEEIKKDEKQLAYLNNKQKIQNNDIYKDVSIFDTKRFDTAWFIAYTFKDKKFITLDQKNQQTKVSSNNISKMKELQAQVDARNEKINSLVGSSLEVAKVPQNDLKLVNDLIKARSLSGFTPEELQQGINLANYKLQMIFISSKDPKVIINDKIYSNNQKLDENVQIVKIKEDKVLLQSKKETKWLQLNN